MNYKSKRIEVSHVRQTEVQDVFKIVIDGAAHLPQYVYRTIGEYTAQDIHNEIELTNHPKN